jgi:HEPN domain-containing protein
MASFAGWIREAQKDLDRARAALDRDDKEYALYHAHQVVEKSLKGVQAGSLGAIDRTHNLVQLQKSVGCPSRFDRLCEDLTPAYTATRYPDMPDLDVADPESLVERSGELLNWAEQRESNRE